MSDLMEDFIDQVIATPNKQGLHYDEKPVEENISVANVAEVEAMPFVLDGTELITIVRDPNTAISTDSMLDDHMKEAIESHLRRSSSVYSLNYEIENNKILIQDLKSSVVSLKVSTSRIERDVKELTTTVGKYNGDKKQLTASLVDLEFRFNELVTKQEEGDENCNIPTPDQKTENIETNIKEIVSQIEGKIRELDTKIAIIDEQNRKITNISRDIQHNEKIVKDIQGTLVFHAKELFKLEDLKKLAADQQNNVQQVTKPVTNTAATKINNTTLEKRVDEFILKTEVNEQHIATAWVGLIAALFLIPIAYIMGRFF